MKRIALFILLALVLPVYLFAETDTVLLGYVAQGNIQQVKTLGPEVLPQLVNLYKVAAVADRAQIADMFYGLSWKSEEAKQALLADINTQDPRLRLAVQWALGRVSDDEEVVKILLDKMRHDPNPLFRDKAACALASDQVHLTEHQKILLYAGVIDALEDTEPQVRDIAIKVLQIHTGQTKGYLPNDSGAGRAAAVTTWREWLEEYRKQYP